MRSSQAAGGVSRPDPSFVDVDTGNAYGASPNVYIRRFSELRDQSGSGVVYCPDPVTGDSFVIQEGGAYCIVYTEEAGSATAFGISVNADTTVTLSSLPIARRSNGRQGRLASASPVSGVLGPAVWCGYLYAGDVIRAHTNNDSTSTSIQVRFIITRLSTV